ncbi:hypothetical protein Tsp_02458 [Trichinella spiralis]|uniref:hypothetical protein n=1 Tax=Trichinella spiralis TaxID=6334 RepID=UPI0001EFB715|nr:hypothetical protein Tsp_02458 [Trichinella spiralis]
MGHSPPILMICWYIMRSMYTTHNYVMTLQQNIRLLIRVQAEAPPINKGETQLNSDWLERYRTEKAEVMKSRWPKTNSYVAYSITEYESCLVRVEEKPLAEMTKSARFTGLRISDTQRICIA